ncbi:MFS transporter [Streptomyces sp. SCSIO 30461]|uniref:MFS transporter n=1 Tax=Streptomyces sp. SCSIO 30461 TaxID=3118085 RepID=UPI0030D4C98D
MTSTNIRPTDTDSESPPPAEAVAVQPSGAGVSPAPDKRRWAAFVIMTVATFLDMLDGSIVNVAIPTIQHELGASYGAVQWITAGYVMAFALMLITGGRLGDIYGRRKMFLLGVAGFTIASLLCGIAMNPEMLIASRLLQGAAAGIMVPQVLSIIHVTFPDNEKGTVFAVHGTVGGIAATIAPLIGGVIVAADIFGWDWRPIFLVNVPLGVVGFFLGLKYIPESKAPHALRVDLPGVALATLGLLLLLAPLTFGRELGWPAWAFASMVAGVAVLIGFVAYERRRSLTNGSPLVALNLFKARSFSSALGLMLACFTFTGMFMLALYMYMQLGLGWSALRAGVTLLAFAFGAFITASASVIVLVPKFGRTVVQMGAVGIALGLGLFLWINGSSDGDITSWSIAPALFVIGLGFGAAATPISLFGLKDVPHEDAGSASGLINTMQQLGFTIGIAVVSLSFFAPLGSAATGSADELAPKLRQELVAAGVPAEQLGAATTAYQHCVNERFGGENASEEPADCVAPAVRGNEKAVAAVRSYEQQAGARTFSGAFQFTLYTGLGFIVVAFLAAGALPRRVSAPGQG